LQKKAPSFIITTESLNMEQSLVLFSGGIDSTTALYWALREKKNISALTFDYGQRHKLEIRQSKKITENLSIPHKILMVNLNQIGGSSLTDPSLPLPLFSQIEEIEEGLPSTYVPFRNGIFLSLAAAWAEVNKVNTIVCGFNVVDSPNYPDTRRAFVEAMEKAINAGTRAAFGGEKLHLLSPFLDMRKSEIIEHGLSLGADYSYSISCYQGSEIPCMECSSCLLRQKAWEEVGTKDPLVLRLEKEGKL
jgi:7-cyano-7-deazaguanine synthase